jgi:hypothetical protein
MSKHTPGPWEVVPEDRAESRWIIGDEEGGSIASCEPAGPWITSAQADANARLIAAAPDLLAVLRDMLLWADTPQQEASPSWIIGACERARAAIAKAGG